MEDSMIDVVFSRPWLKGVQPLSESQRDNLHQLPTPPRQLEHDMIFYRTHPCISVSSPTCRRQTGCWTQPRHFEAVVALERWWSSLAERRSFLNMKRMVLFVQYRARFVKLKRASLFLQTRWRFVQLKRASLFLQTRWRFIQLKRASLFLQTRWRFIQLKRASLFLQTRWRFVQLKRASLFLQTRWRYKRYKKARHVLQHSLLGKIERRRYLAIRSTVIKIQSLWRMSACRKQYVIQKRAILHIQSWWSRIALKLRAPTPPLVLVPCLSSMSIEEKKLALEKIRQKLYSSKTLPGPSTSDDCPMTTCPSTISDCPTNTIPSSLPPPSPPRRIETSESSAQKPFDIISGLNDRELTKFTKMNTERNVEFCQVSQLVVQVIPRNQPRPPSPNFKNSGKNPRRFDNPTLDINDMHESPCSSHARVRFKEQVDVHRYYPNDIIRHASQSHYLTKSCLKSVPCLFKNDINRSLVVPIQRFQWKEPTPEPLQKKRKQENIPMKKKMRRI